MGTSSIQEGRVRGIRVVRKRVEFRAVVYSICGRVACQSLSTAR